MKRGMLLIISIITLFLLSSGVSALTFDMEITPATQTITSDQAAEYDIILSHDSNTEMTYSIYSPDINWDIYTDPIPVKVPANGKAEAKLHVRPIYATQGYYIIPIHIRPYKIDMFKKEFIELGYVTSTEKKQYQPSIKPTIKIAEQADPSEPITFSIVLQNQNTREMDDITVKVRSKLINKDYKTTLDAKEVKLIELEAKIDPLTAPQKDTITVSVIVDADNRTYRFDAEPTKYRISEYGEISSNVRIIEGFLKTIKIIELTNTGNAEKTMTYKVEKQFKHWFTDFQPEFYKIKTKDGKYYATDVTIPAQESTTLTIETNYRLSVFLLILIIAGLISYYVFRSPITIKKRAIVAGTKEGGITELKVLLHVKNRSKHKIKHVVVLDKIPKIAKIKREFELGSVKPSKIGKDGDGTLVKWNLGDLEALEERIITYKMSSKLTIIGGMTLPVSLIKFKHAKGIRKTRSNPTKIGFSVQ